MACEIIHGDALEVLKGMEANSVDAIVTDPPYGLSFMGKKWDYDVPEQAVWEECLRVLKPGGHLLAFAGTRTQHRMAVRIEDAGFEIRDMIAWVYGSGFPKSLNVANAIHDAAIGQPQGGSKPGSKNHGKFKGGCSDQNEAGRGFGAGPGQFMAEAGGKSERDLVESAQQWQGWGTALKPALEPITVARKPLIGTVAANVLEHGTGALNIDGCRVGDEVRYNAPAGNAAGGNSLNMSMVGMPQDTEGRTVTGRWPANLIHDGSEEVVALFPEVKAGVAVRSNSGGNTFGGDNPKPPMDDMSYGDKGSAARFFYCAKASKSDRGTGNNHPTVKPTELMRYLVRLVTPPGGKVIDPFSGSGSTGKAAVLEGFKFIGIEREAEYVAIAEARIAEAQRQLGLFA